MALHRDIEGSDPIRPEPVERLIGYGERRHAESSWHLATGTLACPSCDVPILPLAGRMSPSDDLSCGYCRHQGAVRDFLSLAEPTRPTRVTVRITVPRRGTASAARR